MWMSTALISLVLCFQASSKSGSQVDQWVTRRRKEHSWTADGCLDLLSTFLMPIPTTSRWDGAVCLPSYQLHKSNFIAFIWYCGLQSWRLRLHNQAFRGNIWHNSKGFFVPVALCPRRRWEKSKVQAATRSSYMTLKSGYEEKTPNCPKLLLGLHCPQRKLRHTRANLRLVFRVRMRKTLQ